MRRLREALEKAETALMPLSNAVFNDNGVMTVTTPRPTYDDCVMAYFAVRRIRAALASGGNDGQ